MPSTRAAHGQRRLATAGFLGSIDKDGGAEEVHRNAARAKLQPPNLFVQSLHSDTIERPTQNVVSRALRILATELKITQMSRGAPYRRVLRWLR